MIIADMVDLGLVEVLKTAGQPTATNVTQHS